MRFKNLMSSVALATAVVVGTALLPFAPAANATTYNYNFTSFDGLLTAIGSVTVIPNGPNFEVTGLTGVVTGTGTLSFVGTQIIQSLLSNPNFPNVSTSPDGAWYYNNVAYAGDPHLDLYGVVFYTLAAGSWNLFSNGPSNYALWEWNPSGGYVVQENGNL